MNKVDEYIEKDKNKLFLVKNKKILMIIPKIVVMMLLTAYLSGFVKITYDYVIVSIMIILIGVFLFFVDIKRLLVHIK